MSELCNDCLAHITQCRCDHAEKSLIESWEASIVRIQEELRDFRKKLDSHG